jgi:hypothetical protein
MKPSRLLWLSFVVSLFLLSHSTAYAQNTWASSYFLTDARASTGTIRQTSDGGFIVTGALAVPGASYDLWVLKLDSSGGIQWQKTYGGINQDDGSWIEQTNDGGYIVVGDTQSYGAGTNDAWILKLDQAGDVQWQQTIGESGADYALTVKQTPDDGFIVSALTFSFLSYDFWIIRLDSSGNVVWQKLFGGPNDDFVYSLNLTSDGGFIVSGATDSFGTGLYDIWVLKLNSMGAIQWQKTYGAASTDEYAIFGTQETTDGGFIVVGSSGNPQDDSSQIIVLKLNSDGTIQWQNSYSETNVEGATSIAQTTDGGYIVAGQTGRIGTGAYWLLKLDSSGNISWQKAYQGDHFQRLASVAQTSDGGFIVSGSDVKVMDFGGGWILKVDEGGNIDPSCSFVTDTNAIKAPTSFIELSTTATATDTTAIPAVTTATATLGNAEYSQQCANQCVFCDSFGDGVLATDWIYSKPFWNEAGGSLIGSPSKRKTAAIANPSFAGCDVCSVQATMQSTGGMNNRVSLLTHYLNNKTNVELMLKEEQDKVVLKQRSNGVVVLKKKSNFMIDANTSYNVLLSYDGAMISLSINGVAIFNIPSVGALPAATVGFQAINTTALFDEIRVD